MKNITGLAILYLLLTSFCVLRSKKLLETFKIGNFTYQIYDEEGYVNTEKVQSHFYVLYIKGKPESLCSSYLSTIKEGKLVTKGIYSYTGEYLECKEYFIMPKFRADSMMKRYYPEENGNLKMKEIYYYRNGKAEPTPY
jgi:antitoxin component YwqK of YwqJK toxin-antitoxin module